MLLSELKSGEKGIVTKVKGRGAFRKRIMEMGFVSGKEVEVIKNAPFRDPIEYKIMGYNVSLRQSEANMIEVLTPSEVIQQPEDTMAELRSHRGRHHGQPRHGEGHGKGKHFYKRLAHQGTSFRGFQRLARERSRTINIALVGNPNSGKTTLFNRLSKSSERVGNYGGVTVQTKETTFRHRDYTFNIADLPGTYSITEYSPEELYVRNYIFDNTPDIIINVVDAGNLERNLYLTTQLIDMDIRVIIALNMYDELEKKGDHLDHQNLSQLTGIPIVPLVAIEEKGIDELLKTTIDVYEDQNPSTRHIHINYGHDIESALEAIQEKLREPENKTLVDYISTRHLSIKLLEGDRPSMRRVKNRCTNSGEILETAKKERLKLESHLHEDSETLLTDARYAFINGALRETFEPARAEGRTPSEKIDRVLTHKILGFPIFLFFMWLTFTLTFSLGQYPMEGIDIGIGWLSGIISQNMPESLLKELIVDGILAGVGGVIIFLPNILILFFMISLMEDTGYMARAAFIMDKLMHRIGLHGKSFIPLIMGFGCNVPAIMATRTIESRNDRLLTMMIIPFMSCSARLPVYVLLISAFFSGWSGSMLFFIYIFGILVAVLSALMLKRTLFQQDNLPFVMELPPYRRPYISTTLKHMWEKGVEYLKKIGGIILVASIIIWALGRFPLDPELSRNYDKARSLTVQEYDARINTTSMTLAEQKMITDEREEIIQDLEQQEESERLEKSFIGQIGHLIEPLVAPLGFDWKMGVSLVTGLAAKEIVVSTMGVLYQVEESQLENQKLVDRLRNQIGRDKGGAIQKLQALSFIVFILLYFPCIGVVAAIRREAESWFWPFFSVLYTTGVAWIISLILYQGGRFIIL